MRLKNTADNFSASFHITPPYQMVVIHSSKLIYPRELYQRGIQRKRVELIAKDFNEYTANEPKVSFRNGRYYVCLLYTSFLLPITSAPVYSYRLRILHTIAAFHNISLSGAIIGLLPISRFFRFAYNPGVGRFNSFMP